MYFTQSYCCSKIIFLVHKLKIQNIYGSERYKLNMQYVLLITIRHSRLGGARIASDEIKYHSGAEIMFCLAFTLTLCASQLSIQFDSRVAFPRIQRQGLQSDQSPPFIIEFKTALSYTFTPYIFIIHSYKFSLTCKINFYI
jgi:hypothetical protein